MQKRGDFTLITLQQLKSALQAVKSYITSYVDNQTGNKISSTSVAAIWTGTQAEYDVLTPDANTLYFIQEV